jgi:hypothetical protein
MHDTYGIQIHDTSDIQIHDRKFRQCGMLLFFIDNSLFNVYLIYDSCIYLLDAIKNTDGSSNHIPPASDYQSNLNNGTQNTLTKGSLLSGCCWSKLWRRRVWPLLSVSGSFCWSYSLQCFLLWSSFLIKVNSWSVQILFLACWHLRVVKLKTPLIQKNCWNL